MHFTCVRDTLCAAGGYEPECTLRQQHVRTLLPAMLQTALPGRINDGYGTLTDAFVTCTIKHLVHCNAVAQKQLLYQNKRRHGPDCVWGRAAIAVIPCCRILPLVSTCVVKTFVSCQRDLCSLCMMTVSDPTEAYPSSSPLQLCSTTLLLKRWHLSMLRCSNAA